MIVAATDLAAKVRELGPWFHNLDLHGVCTAPDHPLGPFLTDLWAVIEAVFPRDMRGLTVLDIGCNAGFYSLKLHERGARVTGIDHDPHYLSQARFAADVLGADIDYLEADVYELNRLGRTFDYVLFMGVFYHLRYPLLALDRVAAATRQRLVFQSLVRGSSVVREMAADYPISEEKIFEQPGMPALYFVEHSYAGDATNWWIPNDAAVQALLRSAGFRIKQQLTRQVYVCSPRAR
jgi:tRNA (mo5U34)-methyltransferase